MLPIEARACPQPKALAAAGKQAEAIRYAEDSKGLNAPLTAIAAFCEGVLLDSGFADEAYVRYAVAATYATTNLATFNAIVKKYPHIPRETILRDLVARQARRVTGSRRPRMPDFSS